MATEVVVPKIGFAMNEGQVAEWLAEDGASVEVGQPLFTLESEKSTNEVEAPASGVLRILFSAGSLHPVGAVIAMIE